MKVYFIYVFVSCKLALNVILKTNTLVIKDIYTIVSTAEEKVLSTKQFCIPFLNLIIESAVYIRNKAHAVQGHCEKDVQ